MWTYRLAIEASMIMLNHDDIINYMECLLAGAGAAIDQTESRYSILNTRRCTDAFVLYTLS